MSMTPVPFVPPVLLVLADVGAGRDRDERERARHERRRRVQRIQLVEDPEIVERLVGASAKRSV